MPAGRKFGYKVSEEAKLKIKIGNTGKKMSEESKKKMSVAKLGKNHPLWRGKYAGVPAIHRWVEHRLGKPSICEHCGTTTSPLYDWANKKHTYKRILSDWIRLCRSCHKIYDFKNNKIKQ